MIKRLFKKYLIKLLLSDKEVRRLLREVVLTSIERKK
jgi:hypothetical protein